MKTSPAFIEKLQEKEVFVFGSNLSGIHGAGAARLALNWGAVMGNGIGIQGSTYAIPTKSEGIVRTLTIEEIKPYVDSFVCFAKENKDCTFLVTEIGCGLAGHSVENIAPLFSEATSIENILLPQRFLDFLIQTNK